MHFFQKTVIVTGGASGIGEAAARTFAAAGAQVAILDLNEQEGNRVVQQLCDTYGPQAAIFAKADVSSEDEVASFVAFVVTKYGRIDVVVNNAATILPKAIEEVAEHEWDRLVAVNLKSVYLMTKHTIVELRKNRGCIVNMASLNGMIGQRQNAAYAATKGAIIAMTKALALDYAADGVRVNCICPAGVITPLLEKWMLQQDDPLAARKSLNDMHALGRPASSREIADAALFLASEHASFITGVALPVEGGAMLGY